MKNCIFFGNIPLLVAASVFSLTVSRAAADIPAPTAPYQLELWKDPRFIKQFTGSYGILSEVEPPLNDVEREQMQKLSAVMGSNPQGAMVALARVTTPESSGQFDFVLGNLALQSGLPPEKAISHYAAAIKKYPQFRRAYFALGRTLVQMGMFDKALGALSKAVELGGVDASLYGLLGYCHLALDNAVSAESAYRSAMLLQPKSMDWKMGLVRSLLKQEKADDLIALCDQLIVENPERPEFWSLQVNGFLMKKDMLRAASNLEIIASQGKSTPADLFRLGDIYLNEKLPDAALAAYRKAVQKVDVVPFADAMKAVENLAARNGLEQAGALLEQIGNLYGKKIADTDRRRIQKVSARIEVSRGAADKSAAILEEVVASDPMDGEAIMLLAQYYAGKGEKDRAILYYSRAEGIEAFEADASVKHAQLLVGMQKIPEAVPLLKRAQDIKPRDSVASYLAELERYVKNKR